MTATNLVSVGAAATADLLSALSLPGGNTLQTLVTAYLDKQRGIARDALLQELRGGYHGVAQMESKAIDPLIGIMMRFWRAAEEGLAADNLRLLAQVIAGLKKNRTLDFDRFARWSSVLENLSREQLLVAGAGFVFDRDLPNPAEGEERRFWLPFRQHMASRGFEKEELELVCATLARHGLFRAASAFGATVYVVTPWLTELGALADLEGMADKPAAD